jgi:hypothetical protein
MPPVTPPSVTYTSPPDGNGALVPTPGFPGRSQKLGSAYRTRVLGLLAAADGSLWVAHADETSTSTLHDDRTLVVERVDPGPEPHSAVIVAQADILPADLQPSQLEHVALCGHPSGEVTLAAFVATGEPHAAALALTRFAADGTIVRTAYIDETDAPVIAGHAAYRFGNDLDCASDGEDLLLITTTQDLRLYRLASDLSVRWSQPVMPLKYLVGTRVRVALGDDGTAVTARTLWAEDRAAFAQRFGATLPATNGGADVLITRFGADGTRLSAGLLGGPGVELLEGLRVDGDRISVLAEMTLPATHDIDIVLLAGDPARSHTEQAVDINLCNEDEIFDVIPGADGGFVVAGGACATPGDISTRVGYVATLGPDGRRQGASWFTSERDTLVEALAPSPSGELALAGIRNGPTTATHAPDEFFNEGWVGLVSAPANR